MIELEFIAYVLVNYRMNEMDRILLSLFARTDDKRMDGVVNITTVFKMLVKGIAVVKDHFPAAIRPDLLLFSDCGLSSFNVQKHFTNECSAGEAS